MFKARTLKRACAVCLVMLIFLSVSGLASAVTLDKSFTFYMVPNAHIDTAWQWPYQHTADTIIRDTYGNMISRVKTNSTYRFSTSASKHYEYCEEYYPSYWEDLLVLVENGQWDITGGQIVEPDLNVPSGESLTRQGLYAQHYFEEKFGPDRVPKTAFVPDVFGFSGQFPQVIKKTGMDYFVTSKLNWNDTDYTTNRREADIQWWQALDGESNVLSYILSRDYPPSSWSTSQIQTAFDRNWDAYSTTVNTGVKTAMGFYGGGDHGGGPSLSEFGSPATLNGQSAATVKMASATQYFEETSANEDLSKVPVHQGEYYFEYHRGTYTTWSRVKRYNRTNEVLADAAEKAATISYWTGGSVTNSMDKISDGWDKVLINQMHDVLPGSSAPYQYYVAFNYHELAKNLFTSTENNALKGLAYQADTNVAGIPVFVYNPLNWARSDYAEVTLSFDGALPASVVMRDGATDLPTNIVARDEARKTITVSFRADNIPAIGYKVYSAVSVDAPVVVGGVAYDENTMVMENENLKVTINPATGNIKSLINKKDGNRETIVQNAGTEAGELQVYVDTGGGSWPAWDLMANEMNKEPDYILNGTPTITVLENTAVRVTLRVARTWLESTIIQDITLTTGSDRVEVLMGIDWRQSQRLLKVSFPILADTQNATYETGYGAVARPTTRDDAYGRARFEVPGHKWFDVTDKSGAYGVSVLNDGKYGFDSLKKTSGTDTYIRSRITAVRSPNSGPLAYSEYQPSPHIVDLGYQEFSYAIYPHASGWEDAKTVNKGYEFNTPLTAFQAEKHAGSLPSAKSFVSVDKANVIVSAVKQPYDDSENKNTFIVRMYEATGRDTADVTLKLPANVVSAREVNMLEHVYEGDKPVTVAGDAVTFDIGHYEVLTLEVKIEGYTGAAATLSQKQVDLSAFFNLDGVSSDANRRDGDLDGKGNTVPVRNWPDTVDYQGITFSPAPAPADGENSYVEARGQTIPLPAGSYNKIFLLGVSAGKGDIAGDFRVNYADGSSTEKNIEFADWNADLSGWDRFAKADIKPYTLDSIAYTFTHYHDGVNDQMTVINYLYAYAIDVDPAKGLASLTLPDASGIKLVAVTAAYSDVPGYAGVYEKGESAGAPTAPTNLVAEAPGDTSVINLTWTASASPDIVTQVIYRGVTPDFVPNNQTYLGTVSGLRNAYSDQPTMRRTYYYKVVAINKNGAASPPSEVSNAIAGGLSNYCLTAQRVWALAWVNNSERPELACDGNLGTKWCVTGITTANNYGFLNVQLVPDNAEPREVLKFYVAHGGVSESTSYNTRNFNIDYSLDGQNWTRAVTVTNNTDSETHHLLDAPVKARYVRLHVVNGEQGSSNTARIYEFAALGMDEITFVPTATNASISSAAQPATTEFSANYTFSSKDPYANDVGTTFQWFLKKNGVYEPIAGATGISLSLSNGMVADAEAIKCEITPADQLGNTGAAVTAELLYNTPGANVLRGKTVISSSGSVNSSETPAMMLDGNIGTKWCQEGIGLETPGFTVIDMGGTYLMDSFKLFSAGANPNAQDYDKQYGLATRDYDIEVSLDGVNWELAAQVRGNYADIVTTTLAEAMYARYVRLTVITPNSGQLLPTPIDSQRALRILEFEGYGEFINFGSRVGLATLAGKDLTASFYMANNGDTAEEIQVIAVLYGLDGRMADWAADVRILAPQTGEDFEVTLAIPANAAGYTYKLFLWRGGNMIPVVKEASLQ